MDDMDISNFKVLRETKVDPTPNLARAKPSIRKRVTIKERYT